MSLADHFWEKVCKYKEEGACWTWLGATDGHGYGEMNSYGKHIRVPRLAWELAYGPIPKDMWVLHKCDNRICVRPDHLFLGTPTDNVQDMITKGRSKLDIGPKSVRWGENAHAAKLTQHQVDEIRAKRANGATLQTLASEYHVSFGNISKITLKTRWKH